MNGGCRSRILATNVDVIFHDRQQVGRSCRWVPGREEITADRDQPEADGKISFFQRNGTAKEGAADPQPQAA